MISENSHFGGMKYDWQTQKIRWHLPTIVASSANVCSAGAVGVDFLQIILNLLFYSVMTDKHKTML